MNTQLHWLIEILLVARYADVVWSEGFVAQLCYYDEGELPFCGAGASCVGGEVVPSGEHVEDFHGANCNWEMSVPMRFEVRVRCMDECNGLRGGRLTGEVLEAFNWAAVNWAKDFGEPEGGDGEEREAFVESRVAFEVEVY